MKRTLCVALVLLVSGCAQLQEAQRQMHQNRMNSIEATCLRYGFAKGAPELSQCMMQIDQNDRAAQQRADADRQSEQKRRQTELQRAMILRPSSPTTTCTSTPLGNTVQTVCR